MGLVHLTCIHMISGSEFLAFICTPCLRRSVRHAEVLAIGYDELQCIVSRFQLFQVAGMEMTEGLAVGPTMTVSEGREVLAFKRS